jgi:BioD-like phosphotransacetylase family protein
MKKLYIASTKQADGKTVVTLGLMKAFSERVKKIGFIKPLGLSELKVADYAIDHDASLMERVFSLHSNIKDMNPATIDRNSIDYFAEPAKQKETLEEIVESFHRVSEGRDMMLIKGTVGAACGSVYGLSNALIAKTLGAKVVLLTSGGIGHPLDDVVLNLEHFQAHGLEVIGVIFNKVFPQEVDKLRTFGAPFLQQRGTRLLGVIPYNKPLAYPTMRDIAERIDGKVLAGEQHLGNHAGKILVGAMTPAGTFGHFENNCLLIVGGDRTDMILAALAFTFLSGEKKRKFAGMLLTCGIEPPKEILEMIKQAEIPIISAEQDSYSVVSSISQMHAKISPADEQKIAVVYDLVRRHVDIDQVFELL